MALILTTQVMVVACGTCGEQITVPSELTPRGRDYNDHNPRLEAWLKQHRDTCPDRRLVIPPKEPT